jgi:hypothetical protein
LDGNVGGQRYGYLAWPLPAVSNAVRQVYANRIVFRFARLMALILGTNNNPV